jgi:TonB-dependent starch-binding outer membrane protein SusC
MNSDHKRGRLTYGSRFNYTNKTTKGINPNEEFGGIMARVSNIDPVTPVQECRRKFCTIALRIAGGC